jgi:hypothetical protein
MVDGGREERPGRFDEKRRYSGTVRNYMYIVAFVYSSYSSYISTAHASALRHQYLRSMMSCSFTSTVFADLPD